MKKLSYVFYLVLVAFFASCDSKYNWIPENDTIQVIRKSVNEDWKYKIITNKYVFHTNIDYNVGDTICLKLYCN
jgi:hypothetical protein